MVFSQFGKIVLRHVFVPAGLVYRVCSEVNTSRLMHKIEAWKYLAMCLYQIINKLKQFRFYGTGRGPGEGYCTSMNFLSNLCF